MKPQRSKCFAVLSMVTLAAAVWLCSNEAILLLADVDADMKDAGAAQGNGENGDTVGVIIPDLPA